MGIKRMQGTSAHFEYVRPKDGKRKSDCIYYNKGICNHSKCQTYLGKCIGRLYCSNFDYVSKMITNNIDDEVNKLYYKVGSCHNELINKVYKLRHIESKQDNNHALNESSGSVRLAEIIKKKGIGDFIKVRKKKYVIVSIKER